MLGPKDIETLELIYRTEDIRVQRSTHFTPIDMGIDSITLPHTFSEMYYGSCVILIDTLGTGTTTPPYQISLLNNKILVQEVFFSRGSVSYLRYR